MNENYEIVKDLLNSVCVVKEEFAPPKKNIVSKAAGATGKVIQAPFKAGAAVIQAPAKAMQAVAGNTLSAIPRAVSKVAAAPVKMAGGLASAVPNTVAKITR